MTSYSLDEARLSDWVWRRPGGAGPEGLGASQEPRGAWKGGGGPAHQVGGTLRPAELWCPRRDFGLLGLFACPFWWGKMYMYDLPFPLF